MENLDISKLSDKEIYDLQDKIAERLTIRQRQKQEYYDEIEITIGKSACFDDFMKKIPYEPMDLLMAMFEIIGQLQSKLGNLED